MVTDHHSNAFIIYASFELEFINTIRWCQKTGWLYIETRPTSENKGDKKIFMALDYISQPITKRTIR